MTQTKKMQERQLFKAASQVCPPLPRSSRSLDAPDIKIIACHLHVLMEMVEQDTVILKASVPKETRKSYPLQP